MSALGSWEIGARRYGVVAGEFGYRPRGGSSLRPVARERDPEAAGFGPSGYLVDGRPERRTRKGLFDLNLVFAPDGIETFIDASLPSAPQ